MSEQITKPQRTAIPAHRKAVFDAARRFIKKHDPTPRERHWAIPFCVQCVAGFVEAATPHFKASFILEFFAVCLVDLEFNTGLPPSEVETLIHEERERQEAKWGDQSGHSSYKWLLILTEEMGEVAKAILEENEEEAKKEVIQMAAVCCQILEIYNKRGETSMSEQEKVLDVVSVEDAKKKVSDVQVVGNGDTFQLLCKASSKSQGWMKSAKAMEIEGVGCVVQVTTQQGANVAEALTFVPNVRVVPDVNGGRKLAAYRGVVQPSESTNE